MNLETARETVRNCHQRMDALYQKPVFDEWVIISMEGGDVKVLSYDGPRSASYSAELHADSGPLMREMEDKHYAVGDFEFVQDAAGSHFDACIRLGETSYLLCNRTSGTMAEIRKDPRWLKAQRPFVDVTEKFRMDPLVES